MISKNKVNLLRRKLIYQNEHYNFPKFNIDYSHVEKNYSSLQRQVKRNKEKESYARQLNRAIGKYNKLNSSNRKQSKQIERKFEGIDFDNRLNKKNIKNFKKLITSASKNFEKNEKELIKAFFKVAKIKPSKQVVKMPLRSISRHLENIARFNKEMMSLNDEKYYNNFLKGALRVRAYRLYDKAVKYGLSYVLDLYDKGLSITEQYVGNEENPVDLENPNFMTDENLSMLGFNESRPNALNTSKLRSSEYGRGLEKAAYRLIRK